MTLFETLKQDLMVSMRVGDKSGRKVLAVFVGDLQTEEKRGTTITDEYIIQRLKKAVANAEENYRQTGLDVWAEEMNLLSNYLPRQMDAAELEGVIDGYLQDPATENNMKGVMGYLKTNFNGLYDGKTASTIVKQKV